MASLSLTESLDTIRSITHPKVAKKISDNITAKIPVIYFLNKMGNKEYEDGGFDYRFPVFKELKTGTFYSGTTVLPSSEGDPATTAIYSRKQFTVDIMATGTKMLQNSGNNPEAIINYMQFLVEVAEESAKNTLGGSSQGIFGSGTETDVFLTGLQNIVSSTPTSGTTGNLDRSVFTFWQNQTASIATSFGTSTQGQNALRNLFFSCIRGDEAPTIGILTQSMYINLDRSLTATIQYNLPSPKTAYGDLSFEHLYWHGVPVLFDSNVPANTGYFLNLKYLKLMVHRDRDMTIRDWITPTDQDALLARLYWAGNLVCTNLARQGVVTGSGDTY